VGGDEMNAIAEFLKTFPDDRVAALLFHARDGKLNYESCCCLIGSLNAPHPLQEKYGDDDYHAVRLRESSPLAAAAEQEFRMLSHCNKGRRELVIPMIEAEINRRMSVCRHATRDEAMVCPLYRPEKAEQVDGYHGPNHFEAEHVN